MKDLIIHCPTKELWEKVQIKMFEFTEWNFGGKEIKSHWDTYKEDTILTSLKEDNYKLMFAYKKWAEEAYSHIPIIPAEEYLKEEFKVGDKVIIHKPDDTSESPGWMSKMDKWDGKEVTIETLFGDCFDIKEDNYWSFANSWAEKASPIVKSKDGINVGDREEELHEVIDRFQYNYSSTYGISLSELFNNAFSTKYTNQCDEGHLTNKHMLQKLTSTIKRLLNKNLQTQYRAGYINGGFELTDRGKDALLSLLAIDKEKELAELAQDFIDEVESEE